MKNRSWSNISKKVQKIYNLKKSNTLNSLLNQFFDPTSSFVTTLKSKDHTTLMKDPNKDLFDNPSSLSNNVIDSSPKLETRHHLNRLLTPEKIEHAVSQINTGKYMG